MRFVLVEKGKDYRICGREEKESKDRNFPFFAF
jgi:hypothetical protein